MLTLYSTLGVNERRWSADGRYLDSDFLQNPFLSGNYTAAVFCQTHVQHEGREGGSTLLRSDLAHFSFEH